MPSHDAVRDLMVAALDGHDDDALAAHLATCAACAQEWGDVRHVDAWLRAAPVVEPPPDFMRRVEWALAHDARAVEGWRGTLAQVGLVVAAMATALWGVSTLAWRVAASGDPIGPRILTPLLAGAELFSQSMHGPFGWFATIVLTAGLGLSWFAVLCLPRRAGTPFLRRP